MWLLSVKIVFGGDPANRSMLRRKEADSMPLGATIGFTQRKNLWLRGWSGVAVGERVPEWPS